MRILRSVLTALSLLLFFGFLSAPALTARLFGPVKSSGAEVANGRVLFETEYWISGGFPDFGTGRFRQPQWTSQKWHYLGMHVIESTASYRYIDPASQFSAFSRIIAVPIVYFLILTGLLPAWQISAMAMRARREAQQRQKEAAILSGICPRCGYDLRASPERCPECGSAVGEKELHCGETEKTRSGGAA